MLVGRMLPKLGGRDYMNGNITPDEGLIVIGVLAALVVVAVILGVHFWEFTLHSVKVQSLGRLIP
jgi:hypothetical protein